MAKKKAAAPKKAASTTSVKSGKKQEASVSATPNPESPSDSPAPKKVHERKPRQSEVNLLAKIRKSAIEYLMRRDEMDEDTAVMVVDSMDPEGINALIEEGNTAVIEKTQATQAATAEKGAAFVEEDEKKVYTDFLVIPELAEDEEFAKLVIDAETAAKMKNAAEKVYKENKAKIITKLKATKFKDVTMANIKLALYQGITVVPSQQILIEGGVDPALVAKAWERKPYDDVRITGPKEPKPDAAR